MKAIETQADINFLRLLGNLSEEYLGQVQHLFSTIQNNLEEYLDEHETDENFSLHNYGPIYLLERDDTDLKGIGLTEGLLGSVPEDVCLVSIGGGREAYLLTICYNNSYAVSLLCPKNTFDAEVETWLANQVDNK